MERSNIAEVEKIKHLKGNDDVLMETIFQGYANDLGKQRRVI